MRSHLTVSVVIRQMLFGIVIDHSLESLNINKQTAKSPHFYLASVNHSVSSSVNKTKR